MVYENTFLGGMLLLEGVEVWDKEINKITTFIICNLYHVLK
jgi:hypothetical protein